MKKLFFLLLCCTSLMAADFSIVKDGRPCALIVQGRRSKSCALAAKTLAECVEKATGIKLQIVRPAEAAKMNPSLNRIYVGDTDYGKTQGFDSRNLKLEEYRVVVRSKEMFLFGNDKEDANGRVTGAPGTPHPEMDSRRYSPATLWAVNTVLEKFAGVRFLWPGDLGTYVPKTRNLSVPVGFTFQGRPFYARRQMWYGVGTRGKNFDGNTRFMLNHQQGSRIETWFTDGFQGWWEAYGKSKPEVIALSPQGKRTYHVKPIYVKLCISNPETRKIILNRWRDAGRPDTWSMCPNDGVGFCTCPNCRKWDCAEAQKGTAEQVWLGKVNLTKRYVTLWNLIITQMRKENPNATICVFGYGPYKVFHTEGVMLKPGVLSAIVPGDFDVRGAGKMQWDSWANSGAMLLVRPNWLNTFWFSPYFPLKKTAEFMRSVQNKCAGYEHDSFGCCWPTQGLYCYMLVRMSYRLDLTVDDIRNEYASAFGKGAPAILKWIRYWENYTDRLRGGVAEEADVRTGGLYDQICAKDRRIRAHVLYGCWDALEAAYPDAVMKPAYDLLDEADRAIGSGDPEAKARVQFLRDGMLHVDKMKQVLSLWWKGANKPEFLKAFNELYEMRGKMEKDYVVSRHQLMYNEFARRIRIVPVNPDGSRQHEDVYVRDWMPKMKAEDAAEK